MLTHYNFVFFTNTPSFYKINLCEKIAQKCSMLLIFLGYGDEAVNTQLRSSDKRNFDFVFLNEIAVNKRNMAFAFIKLSETLRSISYDKILYTGWYIPEYNLISLFISKNKNVLICESSTLDVSLNGFKGLLKKLIIKRMSVTLASGIPHAELFQSIRYKGPVSITGGVGIFNKKSRSLKRKNESIRLKYIYVGRLIEVKNVRFLINEFNYTGKDLTIVGKGELEEELKNIAKPNIKFLGFIENENIGETYMNNDVFILPSLYEPWGLVVEEAIYWGLPVIVSDRVGCSVDLVKKCNTGCLFKSDDMESFRDAMANIESNYSFYKKNVDIFDFEKRDTMQVKAYTDLINKLDNTLSCK